MCGEVGLDARREAARTRRLGRRAARPRRPRLRRPPRRERRLPARHQPGAGTGGGAGRTCDPQRVRPPGGRRGRPSVRPRTSTRTSATGAIELQVDELEIVSPARPRCPSSWTRRAWTRRCACAIGGSTCGGRGCSATSGCERPGLDHPHGHGSGGLSRHPDADPLQADPGRRARLRRPEPPAEGPLLRAPAVAADPEAAARHRRLRPLLPDRHLLPGRGSPGRPRPGDHPARRRDGLPGPGTTCSRSWSECARTSGARASATRSRRRSRA